MLRPLSESLFIQSWGRIKWILTRSCCFERHATHDLEIKGYLVAFSSRCFQIYDGGISQHGYFCYLSELCDEERRVGELKACPCEFYSTFTRYTHANSSPTARLSAYQSGYDACAIDSHRTDIVTAPNSCSLLMNTISPLPYQVPASHHLVVL